MKTWKEELEELRKPDNQSGDGRWTFNAALDKVSPIIDKAVAEENYHTRAALHALGLMYMQYCAKAGHLFMSAGENAQSVLEYHGLLSADEIGRGEPNWDKLEALCFP